MVNEYDNIDNIGRTYQSFNSKAEKDLHEYYHKQEVKTVINLLTKMKLKNFQTLVDLGSSHGYWYNNYKNMGFKKLFAIDISKERVLQAKQRGYDEVHACNAYELPFDNESKQCIISNNVLIHVLQDSDKLRIFNEVKRVLKKDGIFIFSIANAKGHGFEVDTTRGVSRFSTPKTILDLLKNSGLVVENIMPSFYTSPRIGAHPYVAGFSTKFVFPLIDLLLKSMKNLSIVKVFYIGVRKKNKN